MSETKTVITYGTYDLLHHGHIRLLERAKELGDYLIVGVTSDQYDKERGKLNVSQSTLERVEAVKALGIADKIVIEEYEGQKISDIKKYNVDIFTVGSDWVGYFDYLNDYCDVVYLDRTQGISSTQLRNTTHSPIKAGIIGADRFAERFYDEAAFVGGLDIVGYAPIDPFESSTLDQKGLPRFNDRDELLSFCDAVFVFGPPATKGKLIAEALNRGLHTWFAAPGFSSVKEATAAFETAQAKNLLLMEGIRTASLPAFEHLILIARSGKIGHIVDVALSCTQNTDSDQGAGWESSFCEWAPLGLLPALKLLGCDWNNHSFFVLKQPDGDRFTRCTVTYDEACATFATGSGIKAENDLVVTGTEGYIYVPAPWWKTDYFEIRHEDLRDTKKVFYQFAGEGLRHGIMEFVRAVNAGTLDSLDHPFSEVIAETALIEAYREIAK